MKKIAFILTIILCLSIMATFAVSLELPLRVVVDGNKLSFPDAQPFIDSNGRTQTPARFIGEALGASVTWDAASKKATFVMDSKKLVLYIGKKEYELDGRKLQMDTAALLVENRTFVPARYVAEAFGATVTWDNVIKTVYIYTDGRVVPTPQATKDPVYGWIKVDTDRQDVEYGISITFTSDSKILEERYDAAEKMFADAYGEDIAKDVFQYLRQKKTVNDELTLKTYNLGKKTVTAEAAGFSILLKVWKEGVVF